MARGPLLATIATRLLATDLYPEPFIEEDARTTANLYAQTQPLGLSLGDRACLALGKRLRLPVMTADRTWLHAQVGVEVRSLR